MKTPILLLAFTTCAIAAETGTLRAGAARVDITPADDAALPMSGYGNRKAGFEKIHDRLYARAIVVADGATQAAILSADLSAVGEPLWERASRRISEELGIPRQNILLAGTHTHGGPSLGRFTDDPGGLASKTAAYATQVENWFVEAVRNAQAAMKPARMGAGEGKVSVNVNRRARMSDGFLWLGRNPDGPSDKTLAVVKFETAEGEPIAIFMNYGVHCTMYSAKNMQITGDLAGEASRFVEAKFGGKIVAPWTSGAAGDQAPIYNRVENHEEVQMLARIMGEEALRVAKDLRMSATARIRGAQKIVTCPGQKPVATGRSRTGDYRFVDRDPVNIRLSLLRITDVVFAGVSAEVLTMIGQRLKQESPIARTMMVTNCNGSVGYIPDDASYSEISYEIVSSPVKKGCAEDAIVDGFLELLDQ